jgi:hypothetical protein
MSFTIANGGVLHLGGTSQTVPTRHLSGGDSTATGFLATGIPQNVTKTDFAERVRSETSGHGIQHAIINVISAGATTPAGRTMTDGSVPTTDLGGEALAPDSFTIEQSRQEIYNFKLFNRSAGDMVVEVKVFE